MVVSIYYIIGTEITVYDSSNVTKKMLPTSHYDQYIGYPQKPLFCKYPPNRINKVLLGAYSLFFLNL